MASSNVTIADRVELMHKEAATQLPAQILDTFRAEQTRMYAEGVPTGAATAGATVPDAELLDVHGIPVSLRAAPLNRAAGVAVSM